MKARSGAVGNVRGDRAHRFGTLDREEAPVLVVHQVEGLVGLLFFEHPEHPGRVGGVRHHEVALLAEAIDDQILDHASAFVQHEVVERLAHARAGEVVRHQPLEHAQRAGTHHLHLAEVREVEQSDVRSHRPMFRERALVLDRHLPSRERGHLRAEAEMLGFQRRPFELVGDGLGFVGRIGGPRVRHRDRIVSAARVLRDAVQRMPSRLDARWRTRTTYLWSAPAPVAIQRRCGRHSWANALPSSSATIDWVAPVSSAAASLRRHCSSPLP